MMDTTHLLVTDLEVDSALANPAVPAAVRAVWQLLWESEVRLDEVLAFDVPDAELDDRLVVIRHAKEGDVYEAGITASAANALRELIGSRTDGPLFTLGGRRLTKGEVATAFREVTGGRTIHALQFTRQRKEQGSALLGSTADQAEGKTT
ncbi:tyrosine-type recombinase/integrase [Streptomyces sp. ISL-12]|uniref:tyrosine-type recombinase/integrase n=1 Tax=Streptomyces sp. ISL-12 TaxID=2819177 RepID=UPI001BE533E3|nr:tyrosine-type recombinase/integrase [Streptomyces sp. ISL-12]MBT2413992.1 tyrosine-type recombinase/integrase [Streptomyces sp. ISL-12]